MSPHLGQSLMRQDFITSAPLPATQRSGLQCRNDKAAYTAVAVQADPSTLKLSFYLRTTASKLFAPLRLPFMLGCMFHSAINLGLNMGW